MKQRNIVLTSVAEEKEKKALKGLKINPIKADFKLDYHPTTSSGDGSKKSKDSSKKAKEEINWLERRLTHMQSIIDLTASKLQNLFNVKAKNNNLNKQIRQTTKLMNQYKIAADRYMEKANSVAKASGKGKNKVYLIMETMESTSTTP